MNCWTCNNQLTNGILHYSLDEFGIPLCIPCQERVRPHVTPYTSPETIILWIALCDAGLPAKLEQFDGYKTIDIAIPSHRLNIEVDGGQHHSPRQALADLKRTAYSISQGFMTLRLPNSLITATDDYQFSDVIEAIRCIADSTQAAFAKNR